MTKTMIITLTTSVVLALAAHAQNILQNPSFESPAIPNDTLQRIAPDAWIPGSTPGWLINWNGGPPSILPLPQQGQQYADVGNEPPFTLSQEFTITNGGFFALQWFDSAGHDAGLTTSPYSVLVLTGAVGVVTSNRFDAYHSEFGVWVSRSSQLALRSGTYTLRFQAEGVLNSLDSLIDNVSLERLPDDDLLANIHCSAVDICWAGRISQLYQVQYRTNVSGTNWFDFGSPVLGTGTNCVTDGINGMEHRFYRVVCVTNRMAGLVADYPFDGDANDVSGQGNNGTVVGATFQTYGAGSKRALKFAGTTSSYVFVPRTTSLEPTDAITVSMWVKGVPGQACGFGWGTILRKAEDCQPGYFIRGCNGGTGFGLYGAEPCGTPSYEAVVNFLPFTGTSWQHIVGTYSRTEGATKTYEQGVLIGQTSLASQLLHTGNLYIGGAAVAGDDGGFNGLINDVQIYNRALSASEVQQLYLSGTGSHP